MRDPEKTIGNIIDKASVSIISSVDENGFPNTKAMLPVRKREQINKIYFSTNTSSMRVQQYDNINHKLKFRRCDPRLSNDCIFNNIDKVKQSIRFNFVTKYIT